MSKYDVADCPSCGKRDFILREDGEWVCLNPKCKFHEPTPEPKADSQSNTDILSVLLAAFMVGVLMMAALGL